MSTSLKEIEKIQEQYINEYWPEFLSTGEDSYINCVDIASLEVMRIEGKEFELGEDENLADSCLHVMFRKHPSEENDYPNTYKGLKVFYTFLGRDFVPF